MTVSFESFLDRKFLPLKRFAVRGLLLIILWVSIYSLILTPNHLPDPWLTEMTGKATTWLLNQLYLTVFTLISPRENWVLIFMGKYKVLTIAQPCNALDLFVLYTGYILCLSTSVIRQIIFISAGISIIFILNVLRCCGIVWLNLNKPEWANYAHHYVFTFIVYSFIFFGWVMYMKNYEAKKI